MTAESRRRLVLLAALVGVSACGSRSGSVPSADATVEQSEAIAPADACYGSELLGPSGERLDLTGTWELREFSATLYFVSQVGTCASWAGGFPSTQHAADIAGSPWGDTTVTFQGTVGSDFVITGTSAGVRQGPNMGDPLAVEIQEWEIHFIDDVAAELTLTVAGEEGTEVRTLRKISDEFLEPLGPSP
jgi:hypothetical protein